MIPECPPLSCLICGKLIMQLEPSEMCVDCKEMDKCLSSNISIDDMNNIICSSVLSDDALDLMLSHAENLQKIDLPVMDRSVPTYPKFARTTCIM